MPEAIHNGPGPEELAVIAERTLPNTEPNNLSWVRKTTGGLLLAGSLTALAFQQAPTNEAVRTAITLEAFENTDNKLVAAVAAGAATMVIEGGTSSLIALGLTREKSAVNRIVERYRRRKSANKAIDETIDSIETPRAKDLSIFRKLVRGLGNTTLALGVGPGILVVKKHLTGENSTTKEALKTGIGFSALGAAVSAGVWGYGITAGAEKAEGAASGTPVEFLVDYATDAKVWAAGVALAGIGYGVSRIRNRSNETDAVSHENTAIEGAL
jgi:hypothetical protein